MAWMRKARIQALNVLQQQLKSAGEMGHDEALRYVMNMTMVSRITAERYIQDLIFMGRIIENKNKLKMVTEK